MKNLVFRKKCRSLRLSLGIVYPINKQQFECITNNYFIFKGVYLFKCFHRKRKISPTDEPSTKKPKKEADDDKLKAEKEKEEIKRQNKFIFKGKSVSV